MRYVKYLELLQPPTNYHNLITANGNALGSVTIIITTLLNAIFSSSKTDVLCMSGCITQSELQRMYTNPANYHSAYMPHDIPLGGLAKKTTNTTEIVDA